MTDIRDQLQQDLAGTYTLEHELTGGGMSRVFVARDKTLGRQVAIKILPPEMAAAVSSQRFRREIQLAANLQHAHIVPLLSAGEINGHPYFTMPYVKGESLKTHLAKVGELPFPEAIRILREVASALAYAHENNIVHRDIKPDNVLISGDSAVVTDFGVAKALSASSGAEGSGLTSMGIALGTPAYMAPEQATADPHTDHRADLYALGVMAYEMITGTTPFANRSPQATLAAHVTEVPENVLRKRANTPPGLAAIVMRCLEKRAADRPQSAREVMHLLDALSTPSGGMTPTASYPVVRSRKWLWPAIAAVVLIAGATAAYKGVSERKPAAILPVADERSIAVLPFKNLSGDPSNDYFGDALSEELLSVLSQIPGLRVAARASSSQFKGQQADIGEIGSKLGVENILDGSVRKSGDRVRITAQLVDVKTGFELWTETFDRTAGDAIAVQEEITAAIGQALRIQLSAITDRLQSRRQVDPRAYDMYLKALFADTRRDNAGMKDGLNLYKQVLQLDSGFTDAWASMSFLYVNMSSAGYMSSAEAIPQAEHAARRALAQDSANPKAQGAHATVLLAKGDLNEAEAVFRSIIEKNPNSAVGHANYSSLLTKRRKLDEAVKEAQIAQRLDPLSYGTARNLGLRFTFAGRSREAVVAYQKAEAMRPEDPGALLNLAQAFTNNGDHELGVRKIERAASLSPDDPYVESVRAYIYARAGRRDEALRITRELEMKPDAINFAVDIAANYAALGDNERAFAWLDKVPTMQGIYPDLDPSMIPLRGDPRFAKFLEKWNIK